MNDIWGPWIEHDGLHVPKGIAGEFVHSKFNQPGLDVESGSVMDERMEHATGNPVAWIKTHGYCHIARYRIRKPRALIEMIERAQSIPQPHEVS